MSTSRFQISAIFKGIDKFSAPVAKMTTRMSRFTRATRRGMRGISRNATRMVRGMRSMALTVGSLAAAAALSLKGLTEPAVQFEHAIKGINAVTRDRIRQEGRLNEVQARALDLGKDTVFTSVQIANAMKNLARAGLDTTGIIESILPILHAAGAEGAAIEDVSKVVVSTMKGFGLKETAANAKAVADSYASVSSAAKTTILELAEGTSKFAPFAKVLGLSAQEAIAYVAALQDVGAEASMSGTQLKVMAQRLATLSPKAKKGFKALDIDIYQQGTKRIKKFQDFVQEMARGVKAAVERGVDPNEIIKTISDAFGTRGGFAGILLAASAGKESKGLADLLVAATTGSIDAASDMYTLAQESTQGARTEMLSAWEFFRVNVFGQMLPGMEKIYDRLRDWFNNPENIKRFQGYVENIRKAATTFWNENKEFFVTAFEFSKKLIDGLGTIVSIINTVLTPIRWVITKMLQLVNLAMEFVTLPVLRGLGEFFEGFVHGVNRDQPQPEPQPLGAGPTSSPFGETSARLVIDNKTGNAIGVEDMSKGMSIVFAPVGMDPN